MINRQIIYAHSKLNTSHTCARAPPCHLPHCHGMPKMPRPLKLLRFALTKDPQTPSSTRLVYQLGLQGLLVSCPWLSLPTRWGVKAELYCESVSVFEMSKRSYCAFCDLRMPIERRTDPFNTLRARRRVASMRASRLANPGP